MQHYSIGTTFDHQNWQQSHRSYVLNAPLAHGGHYPESLNQEAVAPLTNGECYPPYNTPNSTLLHQPHWPHAKRASQKMQPVCWDCTIAESQDWECAMHNHHNYWHWLACHTSLVKSVGPYGGGYFNLLLVRCWWIQLTIVKVLLPFQDPGWSPRWSSISWKGGQHCIEMDGWWTEHLKV